MAGAGAGAGGAGGAGAGGAGAGGAGAAGAALAGRTAFAGRAAFAGRTAFAGRAAFAGLGKRNLVRAFLLFVDPAFVGPAGLLVFAPIYPSPRNNYVRAKSSLPQS